MPCALFDLVLPSGCVGCRAPARGLCAGCRRALDTPFGHVPVPQPAHLPPLWVASWYQGPARAAILGYKERGRRDLVGLLADALARALSRILRVLSLARLLLVPVPSRRRAARLRGGDHVRRLADHAAATLRPAILDVRVAPLLGLVTRPRDAAGLTAEERADNLRGAFGAVVRVQKMQIVDFGGSHSTDNGGGSMKYMLLIYAEEDAWTEEERQECYVASTALA